MDPKKIYVNSPTNKQNFRRQTYIIPKRRIFERYPMVTLWSCTGVALLIFFSRPIYDIFIREPQYTELKEGEKLRDVIYKAWKV